MYSDFETRITGHSRSSKNDTIQSGAYDFLLTFHSNHRPISHRFRDTQRLVSKIATFSHPPVYLSPQLKGFPLEFGICARVAKAQVMWLSDGRKSFKIDLVF